MLPWSVCNECGGIFDFDDYTMFTDDVYECECDRIEIEEIGGTT